MVRRIKNIENFTLLTRLPLRMLSLLAALHACRARKQSVFAPNKVHCRNTGV
jgi:hypothetical protein